MESSTEPEWHPYLKMFTIMAIPAGLIFCISGWGGFIGGEPVALLALIGGVATLAASIYALIGTDYYRQWNSGVSSQVKLAAFLAIYMGVIMTIALFLVAPFMRFMTDAIGGGPGSGEG